VTVSDSSAFILAHHNYSAAIVTLREPFSSIPEGSFFGSVANLLLQRECIKVRGRWIYLYHAIDSNGVTVEFWFSEQRNLTAAKRCLRKALERHERPERIELDGSQTNREAILSCGTTNRLQDRSRRKLTPSRIRPSACLTLHIEQDHRAVNRRIRPMLGSSS
jgi:transposase-like protein